MSALHVYVDGIGLRGPGLNTWEASYPILVGSTPLELASTQLPTPEALPSAERRRVGTPVKLSMAIAFEAARHAQADPAVLPTVFSATGGDGDNCHTILEMLASDDRQISPTRFHNSVHNAPSGYWSIATGCMAPSTSLCSYDATFAAGLLEAASIAVARGEPCLLVAYDTAYPDPLNHLRPIPYPMGVAMVLNPQASAHTLAELSIELSSEPALTMADAALENLRTSIPVARCLPLLAVLAQKRSTTVVLDYLENLRMRVALSIPGASA